KDKDKAPANKASDLNTGIGWLLQREINDVPERIKSSAINLREAIKQDEVEKIYVWYVHNLPESTNVEEELKTVQQTVSNTLNSSFSEKKIQVIYCEVGTNCLQTWYEECQTPILVTEEISFDCKSGYEIEGEDWKAYCTAVSAEKLYQLYRKYQTKIFSANIRDYLGSRASDSNINNGIKNTVENDAGNFWVYNNGLTIITHSYDVKEGESRKIIVSGLSIVNGAQTTGAIGSLKVPPGNSAMVQARFIAINQGNPDLIQQIIQFNNSQNKVEAADFRSTDKIQKRLKTEMQEIPDAEYEGGRRGGAGDAIRRRPNLLASYSVGQALAAFHGDPITAYNKKSGIWINDRLYSKYFNERTKASHLVCTYSLVKAIETKKEELIKKQELTTIQSNVLSFFRKRGSIYLFTYAISSCLEVFLDRKIPDLFSVSFGKKCSPIQARENWNLVIDKLLPFCTQLNTALDNSLKNIGEIEAAINNLRSLVAATRDSNQEIYSEFADCIEIK
uniref:AIPR family protein n=3 Tax=Cyanobacteriota TaxID=1117 RepID=UPI0030D9E2AA